MEFSFNFLFITALKFILQSQSLWRPQPNKQMREKKQSHNNSIQMSKNPVAQSQDWKSSLPSHLKSVQGDGASSYVRLSGEGQPGHYAHHSQLRDYNHSPGSSRINEIYLNEKTKAPLLRQKAELEDNKNDLAYMELISNHSSSGTHYGPQKTLISKGGQQNGISSSTNPNKFTMCYRGQQDEGQGLQMRDISDSEASPLGYQLSGNRKTGRSIEGDITPAASTTFEGVRNVFQKEIDILKENISKCQQHQNSVIPDYQKKEELLWQSFSLSPSPSRRLQRDFYESPQPGHQPTQQSPLSPSRPNDLQMADNQQKNEMYLHMLKNQPGGQPDDNQISASSYAKTYKSPLPDDTYSSPTPQPRDYKPQQSSKFMSPALNSEQNKKDEGKLPIEEQIELLRRENELLKLNLSKQNDKRANNSKVSFASKDQRVAVPRQTQPTNGTLSFVDQTTNPYDNNLYNQALVDGGQKTRGQQNSQTNFYHKDQEGQNLLCLSPIPMREDQVRYGHFSSLSKLNEDQHQELSKEDLVPKTEAVDQRSPYAKLSYYEQVMKDRQDRVRQEQEQLSVEKERNTFQRNVLRRKFADEQKSQQKKTSRMQSQYQTPTKSKGKPLYKTSNQKTSMMKRYSGLPQFALNKKKEVVVAGDSYIRRISKYEIDRNEIDFNKLRREKEADRTKNVKINKQIIDHNLDGRHQEEVRATDYKIALLSQIKEQQDRERQEAVRQKHEEFRKALEERNSIENNDRYMSPQHFPSSSTKRCAKKKRNNSSLSGNQTSYRNMSNTIEEHGQTQRCENNQQLVEIQDSRHPFKAQNYRFGESLSEE